MTPAAIGTIEMPVKTKKKRAHAAPKPSAPGLMIVRIELLPDGKDRVKTVAGWFGMTQIAALSRLVEWFAGQSDEVQRAVLAGPTNQAKSDDLARTILTRMAASDRPQIRR